MGSIQGNIKLVFLRVGGKIGICKYIILSVIDYFTEIVALLADLTDRTGINATLVGYLVKIVGAGYIIEFACDTAEDAKLPTLANKIALGGKVVIFCLTIPVVTELVNIVISLLSSYS